MTSSPKVTSANEMILKSGELGSHPTSYNDPILFNNSYNLASVSSVAPYPLSKPEKNLAQTCMSQTLFFTGQARAPQPHISRNTLVITNSGYSRDQQRLSGISLMNEICLGLPANVSWDELLRERPSDVTYLRKLLDYTRTLNREYKRKRKTRTHLVSSFTKPVPNISGKSYEKCTKNQSSYVKTMESSKTVEKSLGHENDFSNLPAEESRSKIQEELCSLSEKSTEELSTPTMSNSSANNASNILTEEQLKIMKKSRLVTEDEIEDNNSNEIYNRLNLLTAELSMERTEQTNCNSWSTIQSVEEEKYDCPEPHSSKNEEKSTGLAKTSKIPFCALENGKKKKRKRCKDRESTNVQENLEQPMKTEDDPLPFEDYYDDKRIQNGIVDGILFQEILRINPKNSREAYINCPVDSKDIFIDGVRDRNRALEGDEVIVKLHPPNKWKRYSEEMYQKCGRVVAISQENHPRTAVGYLKIVYGKCSGIILWPRDNRLPRIRVTENTCPPKFRIQHQRYKNILFLAKIVSWETVKQAEGVVLRALGDENSVDVESECILLENNIELKPFENEEMLSVLCREIPETELKVREDIRKECVFTIDPPTAKDLDDALSWRCLPNGNVEVGVHIADVTHYLLNDTELDQDVRHKATSVYLVNKVYHMLPPKLCDTCSLLPDKDKLAFSVFIEMNKSADVVQHRFSKTIIRSCAQLNYDHAQEIIDGGSPQCTNENIFPTVNNGYTATDCARVIWELHLLAVKMRRRRFSRGALRIDQPKIVFRLNESNFPISYTLFEGRECNWLVEEFMLLANIFAANKIMQSFPLTSLLRHHPAPKETALSTVVEYLEKVGIHIDTSSAGQIYKSMMSYNCNDEIGAARMTVIMHLLVKPMMRARYTCSASNSDCYPESWHYALNTQFYTHFTSPIRRYADIVVHRLLASAIGCSAAPNWTSNDIQKIAACCNKKKDAAKKASERSTELYLRLYVEMHGAQRERAVVIEVKEKFFDVISLLTRSVGRIYINGDESIVGDGYSGSDTASWSTSNLKKNLQHWYAKCGQIGEITLMHCTYVHVHNKAQNKIEGIESTDFKSGNGVPTLKVKWKKMENFVYVQIFSIVDVEIFHKKTEDKYYNNSLCYTLIQ